MIHEPSGLLRHADCAGNFVGTYTVLAVHDLPHRCQPLVQADGRFFHDRARLQGELRGIVLRTAVPAVILL